MIKFFKCLILIAFLLASPAYSIAANYYFDLASGNDTTGDGTSGNPWKTIDKCTTSRSAGDECRGAKTTITTLSGTLTFTNGSTSVATSVDQTGTVAAGDVIGKNSGLEGWWKVASLNSTTITLTSQYWGLSGSGSAVTGYKITPVAASEEYDINSSGTAGNLIKISGGWDLTGPTQDGITCFSSAGYQNIDLSTKDYIEIEKFILVSGAYSISANASVGIYLHDIWIAEVGTTSGIYFYSTSSVTADNISITGGTSDGFICSETIYCNLTSVYIFSVGTGSGDDGFIFITSQPICEDCRAYNVYGNAITTTGELYGGFFNNLIIDTTRYGSCIYLTSSYENRFFNPTISSCANYAINTVGAGNNYFIGGTVSGSSGDFFGSSSYQTMLIPAVVVQETGSDSILYFYDGTITHDSSADARSGKALKFTSTSALFPLRYKVGSVKIPSAASDLTLNAYLKDNVGFNGNVYFIVSRNGEFISKTEKTPTTSYVKESVVVASADLVADDYLDLFVQVTGTAGSVWIDDFSAEQ